MVKKVVFSFPPTLIEEPVTYHLVKDFDLQVNILRATVRPRDKGRMVVELKGKKDNMNKALAWLEDRGVQVDALVQEMRHLVERCTHCTACVAMCPTGALAVDPDSRELVFDHKKCIICEACIPSCSYGALTSQF
jgi:ferredoxin